MGIPLVHGFVIYHVPINQLTKREGSPVRPHLSECTPLDRETVHGVMAERKAAVDAYLETLRYGPNEPIPPKRALKRYLTDALAPVQEREQKLMNAKKATPDVRDLILVPNWSTDYCPFPDELCDCRHQGTTKIGHYDGHVYVPREGYENIEPEVTP